MCLQISQATLSWSVAPQSADRADISKIKARVQSQKWEPHACSHSHSVYHASMFQLNYQVDDPVENVRAYAMHQACIMELPQKLCNSRCKVKQIV